MIPSDRDIASDAIQAFFDTIRRERQASVPVVNAEQALVAAGLLKRGQVSARRMAREMDATFEDIDATFVHHAIAYRLFD